MRNSTPTPRPAPPWLDQQHDMTRLRYPIPNRDDGIGSCCLASTFVPRAAPSALARDLAAITCYFNPCGYQALKRNYSRFAAAMRQQQVSLYTIELAFDNQPFFLRAEEATLQLRGGDVLWQKERLLNVLLEQVPDQFTKIAWLDADLCFSNPNWLGEASRRLEQFPVVQLFEQAALLNRHGEVEEIRDGVASAVAQQFPHAQHFGIAHPGFAWAARRDLLRRHGLLDHHIGGGGDSLMVMAMYGWWGHPYLQVYNQSMRAGWLSWAVPFWRDVRGRVGCVSGKVAHLWHGSRANRRYNERVDCLRRHNFDPRVDLSLDANRLWRWSSAKSALHDEIKQYFIERREDQ